MEKKKCSLKVWDGEKYLYGTAAVLYKIGQEGYDNMQKRLTEQITNTVIKEITPHIVDNVMAEIYKDSTKPRLKVVNIFNP